MSSTEEDPDPLKISSSINILFVHKIKELSFFLCVSNTGLFVLFLKSENHSKCQCSNSVPKDLMAVNYLWQTEQMRVFNCNSSCTTNLSLAEKKAQPEGIPTSSACKDKLNLKERFQETIKRTKSSHRSPDT